MAFNIVNNNAKNSIIDCLKELESIEKMIESSGPTTTIVKYLTRYSIIRTCGTIEYSFKTIISDHKYDQHSEQIQRFIDEKFRNSSMNPNYDNICKALGSFDNNWCNNFKDKIKNDPHSNKLRDSLKSLNRARNDFAHGKSPTVSFQYIFDYFIDSVAIIQKMESSILELEATNTNIGLTKSNDRDNTFSDLVNNSQKNIANDPENNLRADL